MGELFTEEIENRMPYIRRHFGRRLKCLISFKGFKVTQFANLLGCGRDTLYKYFRSEVFPTNQSFEDILKLLNVDVSAFAYPIFSMDNKLYSWKDGDNNLIEELELENSDDLLVHKQKVISKLVRISRNVERFINNPTFVYKLDYLLDPVDDFLDKIECENERNHPIK